MKNLIRLFLSLLVGITLISGFAGCSSEVDSGDPVIEVGLFLTQTPVTPANGDVTVDVNVIPKKVQMLKWLEGEKTIADFKDSGTELTVTDGTASFTVSKSGNYTVYAKANSRSEAVKTIFVEDVTYDLKDLITLSQSPAVPLNGDVVVEVTLNRQDVQLVKYAKGELEAEAFEKVGTEVVKDENGKYTFTVSEKDWYTVYAKVNSKSFTVKKIDVEDVAFDVSGLISLSQSPASNVPTNAEVTVTALLSRSDAQTVKWAAGTHTIEDFATIRSTELTADEDGKYSFTVTENGTYTVYAQCNSKSKAVNVINVTNIDKVAPAVVTNLAANYVHSSRTINISWGNPAETDLDHAIVNVKNGNTVIVDDAEAKGNSYAVSDYTADNTTTVYISVKVADKAGNISDETTYSFVPKAIPEVQSITLDRYHISNTDTNRKITAIANISNMDALPEGDSIKIQVINTSSGDAEITKTAVLDKAAGTATIDFNAPVTLIEYTVRVKIGTSSYDTKHTARFVVSEPAEIFSMVYEDGTGVKSVFINDITDDSVCTINFKGTNIDLGPVYFYWKNSVTKEQYGEKIELDTSAYTWTATTGDSNTKSLTVNLPCPKEEGNYYVASDSSNYYGPSVRVYGDVAFDEFTIPKVDKTKEDIYINCLISGKNFTTEKFDSNDVEISCSESSIADDYKVSVINDKILMVKVMAPGKTGDFEVTVRFNDKSIKQTLIVRDYSSYIVGSVVLNDKTILPYSEELTLTDEQKNKIVGYIGGRDYYGAPFIVGFYLSWLDSYDRFPWTVGYSLKDSKGLDVQINGSYDNSVYGSDITSISGDGIYAYNNQKIIKSIAVDLETEFPAFNYCETYGQRYSLGGEFESGWNMVSVIELVEILKNFDFFSEIWNKWNKTFYYTNYEGKETWYWKDNYSIRKSLYPSSSVAGSEVSYGVSQWRVSYNESDFRVFKCGAQANAYKKSEGVILAVRTIWDE